MTVPSVPHLLSSELVHHINTNQENLNLQTLFGASKYSAGINKRIIIASGVTIGATSTANYALNIPTGFGGRIILVNQGSILGAGGVGDTGSGPGDGGNAILAGASNIFIDNRGTINAGGGGGGRGGTGGQGSYSYTYSYSCSYTYDCTYPASICTCPVCCGYSCTNTQPCPGGYTNAPNNGCAEGGYRWFCPATCTGTTTCTGTATGYENGTTGGSGGRGQGYDGDAASGSSASNAINNAGKGGTGGTGGSYGNSGNTGNTGANGNYTNGSAGVGGGSAGYYIVNNSNVTWIANGTRGGRVFN